jgi:NADP-dependent 3-hydroxy acid dehydrogenase YdfG
MQNRIKGQWVLITGATSGIGKSAAFYFAEFGCNLILTGRREDRLSAIKSEITNNFKTEVKTAVFDIRNSDSCTQFVKELDVEVDILLNNAGLALGLEKVDEGNFDNWDTMIDTNIKGLLYMSKLISARMKLRGSGHIINIGSIAGREAYSGGVAYSATKYAVRAINEATKKDLHGTGIRVSAVSPGLVATEFSEVRFAGDKNRAETVYQGYEPLTGNDIAEVILFVANRPPHVNILDTIVYPTAQSSATMVHKK